MSKSDMNVVKLVRDNPNVVFGVMTGGSLVYTPGEFLSERTWCFNLMPMHFLSDASAQKVVKTARQTEHPYLVMAPNALYNSDQTMIYCKPVVLCEL